MRRTEDPITNRLLWLAILSLAACFVFTPGVFPQDPGPTPAGDDPVEWSEWLNESEDVQVFLTEEFSPVNTYAGSYAVPRLFIASKLTYSTLVKPVAEIKSIGKGEK